MMAQFKYTEFTTQSGNTQICILRKKKEKEEKKETPTHKAYLRQQKLLGVVLIVISVIGCFIIPEDCGGCLVAGFMGIARIIYD